MTLAEQISHYAAIKRRLYGSTERRKLEHQRFIIASYRGWRSIAEQVCREYKVEFADMVAHDRSHDLLEARRECWYRIRKEIRIDGKPPSLSQIGGWFNRDHSSVAHALKVHERKYGE